MIRIGRLLFREPETRSIDQGPGSLALSGADTVDYQSADVVRRKQQDITRSYGLMVPVVFTSKSELNGYYAINQAKATLTYWASQNVALCDWEIELARVGYANDIDVESRLGGPATLLNVHSGVGERWHAPPPGHTAYWSGAAQPSQVSRKSPEGLIRVYRGIPANTNVRWSCPPELYGVGRARFLDASGAERVGVEGGLNPIGWKIGNALLQIGAVAGNSHLRLETWTPTAGWSAQLWQLRYNGTSLGTPKSVSISRNDYEMVQVRVLWDVSPSGRVTADLTLRRGSRFVEVYAKSMLGATLALVPATVTASTSSPGYITATADDGAGNRYTAGSPSTFTPDATNGGLSRTATQVLDAYIGSVVGGGAAIAGDTAANLFSQFLGAPTERVIGVRV